MILVCPTVAVDLLVTSLAEVVHHCAPLYLSGQTRLRNSV